MQLFKTIRSWIFPQSEQSYLTQYLNAPFGQNTQSGVNITPETSLSIAAIYQAVELISGQMAAMDFNVYRRGKNGSTPDYSHPLNDLIAFQPNLEMNSYSFRKAMMLQVLLFGNCFILQSRDNFGMLLSLDMLDPNQVKVERNNRGRIYYLYEGKRFWSEEIIHIKGLSINGLLGMSPITLARENFALTKATELFGASYFGNGATPGGFFKSDKFLSPEATKEMKDIINRDHGGVGKSHKMAVLPPGVEWIVNSTTAENAQFLLTRTFQLAETARMFSLDPADIGDYSQGRPATAEEANLQLYTRTLMPHCESIEAEFNSKIFTSEERKMYFVKHNMSTLLRGNSAARSDYLGKLYNLGAITTNQIITSENLGETIGEAGDLHFIPNNNLTSLEQIHKDLTTTPVVEAPSTEAPVDPAAVDAVRSVVLESINRMVRREAEAIRRASNKPEAWQATLEAFYGKHRPIVLESIGSSVRALLTVTRSTESKTDLVDEIANQLSQESRSQLSQLDTTAEDFPEQVNQILDTWINNKANSIVEVL